DPHLQAAHRAFPWIVTWDDHDVENNYAGDVSSVRTPPATFRQQRTAAYQAWYEHMPMRIEPPDGPDVRIYHDVGVGDLLRLYVLDERQYGDPPPCRDTTPSDTGPGCPGRDDPDDTFLGEEQERWLAEGLARPGTTWNVLAQQVMMAGLDISGGTGAPAYYLDSWDGHPAARSRLLDLVAGEEVSNPVVLTGDYHAAFVADLRAEPFGADTPVVATELITPAISSALFSQDFTAANPHIGYFAARHGYLVCTVERERWTADFRYVSDVADPDATIETGASFVIEAGRPGARPV
ncbi:MAG: alkaline phosphatase D family protein, partial [Acidimicrobiia bacterium]|nr:alkaline phosphatase D family protein [Acidimicrobiia bacterium]